LPTGRLPLLARLARLLLARKALPLPRLPTGGLPLLVRKAWLLLARKGRPRP
jgi:hypothetical protein